jgi:hypothetical protein
VAATDIQIRNIKVSQSSREVLHMDKRKVITAYRRGFITIQECAQILGMDSMQILGMVNDPQKDDPPDKLHKQSIHN